MRREERTDRGADRPPDNLRNLAMIETIRCVVRRDLAT
jgi:hypothetical protein